MSLASSSAAATGSAIVAAVGKELVVEDSTSEVTACCCGVGVGTTTVFGGGVAAIVAVGLDPPQATATAADIKAVATKMPALVLITLNLVGNILFNSLAIMISLRLSAGQRISRESDLPRLVSIRD